MLFRLHRDEYTSTRILLRPELELAIVNGDQEDDHPLYVHGLNCLSSWYSGQPSNMVHIRHASYQNNKFKGRTFDAPWWWNHPLYIENSRAVLLSTRWNAYKDDQFLQYYLRPKGQVPFIQPHPTIRDNWTTPNGPCNSDWDLWRALGWIAQTESRETRANRFRSSL